VIDLACFLGANDEAMKAKVLLSLLLLVTPLVLTGCLVAAVGAGVGAAKYGSAKQKDAYAHYRVEAEKNNTEREKAGLTPVPILTYDEWKKGQK